jgi:hypothetical protein
MASHPVDSYHRQTRKRPLFGGHLSTPESVRYRVKEFPSF